MADVGCNRRLYRPAPGPLLRGIVRRFDALLCRIHGVYEFMADPGCILRIALARATVEQVLADGTPISPGDLLVEIHLWNERLPEMPREGADLRWARRMYQGFVASLHLLAKYLALDPQLAAVRAIRGEMGFLTTASLDAGSGALTRLGFEIQRPRAGASARERWAEFWHNVYSLVLLWTYNPGSLRGKALWRLERCRLWMSYATLERRYGNASTDPYRPGAGDGAGLGPGTGS